MSHWRRTSVWWTLGLGLVMVVVLGLGGPPQAAAQNPCEEFSGVCHGQCQAALDQGCFENPDTRQCGKREEQWEFHACPGTPPWAPPVKRVFVTSTVYTGNLGGLVGADAKCQERADVAGLTGQFKAWLSTAGTGNSAAERLTHAMVPYVRVDGVQVAANWTALVAGTLAAPISVDEFGNPGAINRVWTGTDTLGSSFPPDCTGWEDGGSEQITPERRAKRDETVPGRQETHGPTPQHAPYKALSSSGGEETARGQRGGRAWERYPRPGRHSTAEVPAATPALTHRTQRRT